MPAQAAIVYKDRDTIVTELLAAFQAQLPNLNTGTDSVIRIWIEVMAQTVEGLFLANQLLHDDMFPQTASALSLQRMGEYWGRPIKGGTAAGGSLRFSGVGGTQIPIGTLSAAPGASDEALRYATTALATVPNPGTPTAPVAADSGSAGNLVAGTYEYAVTFTTAIGETAVGVVSNAVVLVASHTINLTSIPLGGAATVGRKIYRRLNGGAFGLVTTLANNTATTYTDNVAAGSLGGVPPDSSTAEQIDVAAQSEDAGSDYNVGINTINVLADAITGITAVTNPAAFTGGSDTEDIEVFRSELLDFIRAPKSGSTADLEAWAEEVPGVETASAFSNDNMGTPTNGHATVRITGPGGTVPSTTVQNNVLAALQAQDLANITLHVGTFTPKPINVTVTLTLSSGYVLADVSSPVTAAISDYITSIPVGGSVYVSGIIAAVFGLPGVDTLVVNVPSATVLSSSTEKPTVGTITVQ